MNLRDQNPDPCPSEPVRLGDLIAPQLRWIDAMRKQISTEEICKLLDQHYQLREEDLESMGRDELNKSLSGVALYLTEPDAQIIIAEVIGAGNEGIAVLAHMQRGTEAVRDVVIKFMAYDNTAPEDNERREHAFNERNAYEQAYPHTLSCLPEFFGSYALINPEKNTQTLQVLILGHIQAIQLAEHVKIITAERLNEIPELFEKMLKAVEELNQVGIYHFDLSPENILICSAPGKRLTLKIVDFARSHSSNPTLPSSKEDAKRALISFGETWFSVTTSVLQRFPDAGTKLVALRDIADNLREGKTELRQARQYFHLIFDR